jgi:hypothetical protein
VAASKDMQAVGTRRKFLAFVVPPIRYLPAVTHRHSAKNLRKFYFYA